MALVAAAQAGETAAFDSLMKAYRERVYGVVFNLVGNRADAADVTQDVLVKAFTNIRQYNFRSSFFTWVYRIAVHEALNFQRKGRTKKANLIDRVVAHLQPAAEDRRTHEERLSALSQRSAPASDDALARELQSQLDHALQELSEEHRAAVVLVEVEGLSLQEAADVLATNSGTVKSRLHYAKKRLQTLLKPYLTT